ncbi:batten's disease protein Cln3 [Coniella lustricola]|uniref:Protein BTN n=1 Tax=Coniella lustricola TaxID=2025994 RepID=A0A2T2ZUR1_9PEZI|nr:batten's disease protein Cln3 [Coniella lustricola]
MPGSPAWRARITNMLASPDSHVLVAFWLFGLINNVLYVIVLSAAQDLVGNLPKGIVLLADVLPSFIMKLVAPYFIHRVPYSLRILLCAGLSASGMVLVATTPPTQTVVVKLLGVILASLSSGGGELSFLGLTHYYGPMSLAAWGSGTGGAGLAGAGLYVVLTTWFGFSVKGSLLASAFLPIVMLISFFVILPKGPLRQGTKDKGYETLPERDLTEEDIEDLPASNASASLLAPGPAVAAAAYSAHPEGQGHTFRANLGRMKALFFPYMLPLLMVYIAEYTINQGVAPTLLFPLKSSPFPEHRDFYPFYNFLYQLGVFISRSSTPFLRIHHLYLPSVLQIGNLALLTLQSLFNFVPSVYIIFIVVFWEGLLGGAVYVNTFAEIMEKVPQSDREFSLSATSVSDSAGICIASFIGMAMETGLCDWNVQHGRDWCKKMQVG